MYTAEEMSAVAILGTVIASLILPILILLIGAIINGVLCKKLAGRKGYTGYFWTGFFLGLIGLIYVVGLPDLNIRKDMRVVLKRIVSVSDRVNALEEERYIG